MKNWPFLLGAALAVGTAAVVVALAIRRSESGDTLDDISGIISDCHERIRRIESELHQLKPAQAPVA
jgi:hypothetical protein